MALRHTTQPHTAEAQLLVMPHRADAMNNFAAPTDEAVMDQSLSAHAQGSHRKLRNMIILANILGWIVIAFAIRFAFF